MTNRLYTGEERRRAVRFPFDAWVKVEHDGGSFEARGTDFNDDNVRIVHATALPEGTAVTVSVVDEVGNHVVLRGEVIRVGEPDGDGNVTMVIRRARASTPPTPDGSRGP